MPLEDPLKRSAMEGRARRRAKAAARVVEPEPPSTTTTRRHEPGTKTAVVYYLTRNHHLEHPHFMEVTLASPQGLYLRDVTGRLDALRGKGMAAKYSWSCKRSYKTGFVWHDLSADDLLLPTQGTEYVLKGSELPFDQSKPLPMPMPMPGHHQRNNAEGRQPCKPARRQDSPPCPGSSNQGWTSKSPSPTPATHPAVPAIKEAVPPSPPPPPTTTTRAAVVAAMKEHAVPPPPPQPVSPSTPSASTVGDEEQCRLPSHSGSSSNSSSPKTSMASSSGTSSPSPTKPAAAAAGSDAATQTDDKARWDDVKLQCRQGTARASSSPEGPEIVVDEESRCTRAPAAEHHPRSRRSGTLQSLIRAEAAGRRRALPLPEEDDRAAAATGGSVSGRLKPANLLMRLMACGPNHPGFGLVQSSSSYGPPRFPQLEYPSSPELSPLCALKPGTTGASTVRASETENCNGRLLDGALKLSSSSSSRSHHEGIVCEQEAWPKQGNLSRSASKRTSDPSSGRMASSSKVVSFRDDE